MDIFQIFVIAAIQGLTEFLPISSSGHLIAVPQLLGWEDHGLMIDIACHLGTLLAALIYFRRDVLMIVGGFLRWIVKREVSLGSRLAFYIILGTIPAVIVGATIKNFFPDGIRVIELIAYNLIIFGILLWVSDKFFKDSDNVENLNRKNALLIGIGQAVALIPGVSRSGITMTCARFLGINRVEAARYSMLLAMPAIFAAGVLGMYEFSQAPDWELAREAAWAFFFSFLVGFGAIWFLMEWLRRMNMNIFVLYRILFGCFLLWWIHGGAI